LRKIAVYLLGFIIFALLFLFLYQFFLFTVTAAFHSEQAVDYIFQRGGNSHTLAYDLEKQGLITHPRFFILMAKLEDKSIHLKAGGYSFAPGTTAQEILNKIYRGDFAPRQVIFIEGWDLTEIRTVLAANPYLQHNTNLLTPQQLAEQLGITDANPEGWFFPNTYQFYWGDTEQAVLQMAYTKMQQHLAEEWANRDPNLWYQTPYQALIVASLVEKEAHLADERPIIAGVILRRLQKHMRLQIDPTVIYAMGENYHGKITRADLEIKSPYNTYLHYGLPPTPIAAPSLGSLHAALHPDNSDALYFVARGDGSHEFSATLREQDAAIKKYILNKREVNDTTSGQTHHS